MAEPEDLLGKADALMARHHPGRAAATPYGEIPVLEEVVDFPAESDDLPLLMEFVLPAAPDQAQTAAMAARIRAALLEQLQPRIDALIEERLKDGLAPLVEKLFEDLRGELQRVAREILNDATRTAVEQEIERRK
ncbi:MAG: hypothetical protein D4R74_03175 [Betaproteobacteria bacterium]|nr:MAG: hypothetical protein D4R74_03175 [Betaproteobacteria bacterium]